MLSAQCFASSDLTIFSSIGIVPQFSPLNGLKYLMSVMAILEKIVKSEDAKHWADSIPLEFHYTAGVAGEEFLRELKDNGRLIASKCPKCKNSYVPARMYCATCFIETKDRHNIT